MSASLLPQFGMLLTALLVLAGCGGPAAETPKTHPVSGTVTLDGQPLEGARVTFVPEQGAASAALTDAQGKYELNHKSGEKGASLGPAKVTISTDLNGSGDPANEKVPPRYNKNSQLTFTVTEGQNTADFDLKTQ